MDENAGLFTNVSDHLSKFWQQDLVTIGLTVVFVVTIAVLWARGPLENILRE